MVVKNLDILDGLGLYGLMGYDYMDYFDGVWVGFIAVLVFFYCRLFELFFCTLSVIVSFYHQKLVKLSLFEIF